MNSNIWIVFISIWMTTNCQNNQDRLYNAKSTDIHPPKSCMTSSGHEGACIESHFCNANDTIEQHGESFIKRRDGSEECKDPLVCCRVLSEKKVEASKHPALTEIPMNKNKLLPGGAISDIHPPKSCMTSSSHEGACIESHFCNANYTIEQHGESFIKRRDRSEECEDSLVCCRVPSKEKINKLTISNADDTTQTEMQTKCGRINSMGILGLRILNSEEYETVFGEFPWIVEVVSSMFTNGDISNTFLGGGSLIHPRAVLTTAHTVKGYEIEDIIIRAGDWDSSKQCDSRPGCEDSPDESHLHQDRTLEKIVIHEHFSEGGLLNDIAILVLSHDLNIGDNIGLLCLPPPAVEAPPANCITAGWGIFNGSAKSEILRKVELPIVRRSQCEKIFKTTAVGYFFKLHESFICAGGVADKDACEGDGGSPLMCPMPDNPNIYMQSGIVSWGLECGSPGIPTVYTNVAHFRKWIDDTLKANKLNTI